MSSLVESYYLSSNRVLLEDLRDNFCFAKSGDECRSGVPDTTCIPGLGSGYSFNQLPQLYLLGLHCFFCKNCRENLSFYEKRLGLHCEVLKELVFEVFGDLHILDSSLQRFIIHNICIEKFPLIVLVDAVRTAIYTSYWVPYLSSKRIKIPCKYSGNIFEDAIRMAVEISLTRFDGYMFYPIELDAHGGWTSLGDVERSFYIYLGKYMLICLSNTDFSIDVDNFEDCFFTGLLFYISSAQYPMSHNFWSIDADREEDIKKAFLLYTMDKNRDSRLERACDAVMYSNNVSYSLINCSYISFQNILHMVEIGKKHCSCKSVQKHEGDFFGDFRHYVYEAIWHYYSGSLQVFKHITGGLRSAFVGDLCSDPGLFIFYIPFHLLLVKQKIRLLENLHGKGFRKIEKIIDSIDLNQSLSKVRIRSWHLEECATTMKSLFKKSISSC